MALNTYSNNLSHPVKPILLLIFWVVMFLLYGFTLTTNTVFICSLIYLLVRYNIRHTSLILLLLGGISSMVTLHHLYNPGKEVFTNIDHHALKFTGFTAKGSTVSLIDMRENHELAPLFAVPGLNGFAILDGSKDSIVLHNNLCQPVYIKENEYQRILNTANLPSFNSQFTLDFESGASLSVRITDREENKKIKRYHELIETTLGINGQTVEVQQDTLFRFILRSLPLSDLISNLLVPEDYPLDWQWLRGVSIVREKAGLSAKKQFGQGFYISLDSEILKVLKTVRTDKGEYQAAEFSKSYTIGIPAGGYISIGSGMHATPIIKPVLTAEKKLKVDMNTQIKHLLPYEKDSLDHKQTVIVTSDLQAMAEAATTSALYYPVLAEFNSEQQFRYALEYLPEESRVALVCKMQMYDLSIPGNNLSQRKDGTYLLKAGDEFTIDQPGRYVNPNFVLQDFRTTDKFNADKGYWLILIVMLMAGLSIAVGYGRIESKAEIALWLGLMALITYRAFIAWRTAVFPPLEGINETRFVNGYLDIKYVFWGVPLALFIFVLLPTIVYKLYLLKKGDKQPVLKNNGKRLSRFAPYLELPGIVIVLLAIGVLIAKTLSPRMGYVFFPVIAFFIIELLYHRKKVLREDKAYWPWIITRYLALFMTLVIPVSKDTGFGIVFIMFFMLYLALECLMHFQKPGAFKDKSRISIFWRFIRFCYMIGLVAFFVLLMLTGPRMVSLLYNHFEWIAFGLFIVMAVVSYPLIVLVRDRNIKSKWKYAPLVILPLIYLVIIFKIPQALESNRHFLYRSEIHFKNIDDIMLDNSFGSRDLERLFEASQNQWYLGYYLKDSSWEQAVPFSKPYELRSHFNKGVTWDTQKTDVVLNRYVIGEHSIWSVYILVVLFILLFAVVYVSSGNRERRTLLGSGAMLLLICQAIFIIMAVTNRFIFFGQDFPMISQHSLLTLVYTSFLFGIAIFATLKPIENDGYDSGEKHTLDKKVLGTLAVICIIVLCIPPSLSDSKRNFNVGNALDKAKSELKELNQIFVSYQQENRNTLASEGIVKHFKTDEELESASKKRFAVQVKPRSLQSDYSQLVNRFDRDQAFSGKKDESGKWSPEVSNFTYSLYKIYRDQLSKDNRSTDIIHLKADQTGILQFNIAKGYYRLTTPESDEQVWQGDILSVDNAVKTSVLSVKSPMGQGDITFHNSAERLDVHKELSYDFPIYLAKLDNSWIAGNKPVFIARPRGIPFTVKNGATAYPLSMTGRQSYYMVLQSDDCIETERNEHVGNQGGNIYVRGDVNKYFARNMLVNGRRTLVYPLGEKFFYPYHVANIAKATYSGEYENRRKTDVLLSLSYSMTEDIYNNMSQFRKNDIPNARAVIVADGNGKIKAMVTAKNPYRNSGYYRVSPNDEQEISKLSQQFYLYGDNMSEEHTFGDLNFNYMLPGPGSSIKPITFTSVASLVCYDWRKLQLYFNSAEQKLSFRNGKKYVISSFYAGMKKSFSSLFMDETINGKDPSMVDITRYMMRSSNYFNSLMVFMGFYKPDYLREQLAYVRLGRESRLFLPYSPKNDTSFPAFSLRVGDKTKNFNFRQFVTLDGMGRHESGALALGFQRNFELYSDFPQNMPAYQINRSRDLLQLPEDMSKYYSDYAYAFNRVSFLPDVQRTTRQGTKDAITNTTLGASPFEVTPAKMAEMFGKLFNQNKSYRLTLNPRTSPDEYEPFERDPMYDKTKNLYSDIWANYLFKGMNQVVKDDGTARALRAIAASLEKQGYYLYGKTGTISQKNSGSETQLLGLVISKNKLHDIKDLNQWDRLVKDNRFYVIYFSNADGGHNYNLIIKAVQSVIYSPEFRSYMESEKSIDE